MAKQSGRKKSPAKNEVDFAVIAAARREFSDAGFDGASLQAIADGAETTLAAVKKAFMSKEALFVAVVEVIGRELAAEMSSRATERPKPWEALLAGCLAFVEWTARPEIQRIYLQDAPNVLGWSQWRKIDRDGAIGFLEKTLTSGLAGASRAKAGTPALLAHMIAGALRAAARAIPEADNPAQAKLDVNRATLMLLMGLREQYAPS